jgi:membrane glycosyltransferase
MLSSSAWVGIVTRKMGLFLTPEESKEPRVLTLLSENLQMLEAQKGGRRETGEVRNIEDPGVCALHLALLPNRPVKKRQRHQLRALVYELIEDGPEKLTGPEKRSLISDPETLVKLHTLSWSDGRGVR